MLHDEKHIYLLLLAKPQQATKAADYTANPPMTTGNHRVHQNQQVNPLSSCIQLPGHLVSDQRAIAPASQQVATLRLHTVERLKMRRRDRLKRRWNWHTIKSIWF